MEYVSDPSTSSGFLVPSEAEGRIENFQLSEHAPLCAAVSPINSPSTMKAIFFLQMRVVFDKIS